VFSNLRNRQEALHLCNIVMCTVSRGQTAKTSHVFTAYDLYRGIIDNYLLRFFPIWFRFARIGVTSSLSVGQRPCLLPMHSCLHPDDCFVCFPETLSAALARFFAKARPRMPLPRISVVSAFRIRSRQAWLFAGVATAMTADSHHVPMQYRQIAFPFIESGQYIANIGGFIVRFGMTTVVYNRRSIVLLGISFPARPPPACRVHKTTVPGCRSG
jgi:hypothetical protein